MIRSEIQEKIKKAISFIDVNITIALEKCSANCSVCEHKDLKKHRNKWLNGFDNYV